MGDVWGGVSPPKSGGRTGIQSKAYQYAPQRLKIPETPSGKKVEWTCPPQYTCGNAPVPYPPFRSRPLNPAKGYGKHCKLPQQVRAEPGRQTISGVFTRDSIYAIARMPWQFRLSVRLTHGWISQKRLKLGSRNFHHTVAPSL